MTRVHNFNPGPAALPLPVLEQAQRELLDYAGQGMSILEMSHRSKPYEALNAEAEERCKRLLGLDDSYRVLFMQGGASTQFALIPMNLLSSDQGADYLLSGHWSERAYDEAQKLGEVRIAASTKEGNFRRVPSQSEIRLGNNPAYLHMTTNNTIYGTQWGTLPDVGNAPLIGDMSSDIMSGPIAANRFAMIYAGAQKNVGPSGVTIVIIRQDLLERARKDIPTMFSYTTHAKNNSLYNTPPTFGVYLTNLVLGWIESQGGLQTIGDRNKQKAALIYRTIDESEGFYRGHAEPDSRSLMNITFRLPEESLEKQFVSAAAAQGLVGLAGHRSVGGIRASIYNAVTLEDCRVLADFMRDFATKNR